MVTLEADLDGGGQGIQVASAVRRARRAHGDRAFVKPDGLVKVGVATAVAVAVMERDAQVAEDYRVHAGGGNLPCQRPAVASDGLVQVIKPAFADEPVMQR